jgi:hypothetical protein
MENKALESSRGIIGLIHNDCVLSRWFLARPLNAKYAMAYTSDNNSCSQIHLSIDSQKDV